MTETNERYTQGIRVTWIGMFGNLFLTALKAVAGVLAGSTALIADAFHSASDIAGSVVVLGGLKLASKPPDADHHYGHGKLEAVVAKLIAVLLVLTGAGIAWSAVTVLRTGELSIPGTLALAAAVLSILIKEGMYRYTIAVGRRINSTAVIADAWHHRTDALSSVAAVVGVAGARMGLVWLDPAAGLVVAVMIIRSGVKIYLDAVKELIDTAPPPEMVREIVDLALTVDGVKSIHEVKARYHGAAILVDMKLCVNPQVTVQDGHDIAKQAKRRVMDKMSQVENVLIHVNPCIGDSDKSDPRECEFCGARMKFLGANGNNEEE